MIPLVLRRALVFGLVTAVVLGPTGAIAQPAPPRPAPAQPPKGPMPAPQAQPSPQERADQLKREADGLMDNIRYEEALAKYREAYAISASPALLYNMGRALEALARYPEALESLRAFDAKAPPDIHAKVPNLDKLITEIEGRTCVLSVEANAGATVKLGDVVLGKAPLASVRVNAGKKVKIEILLEGFEVEAREVELPGRGEVKIKIALVPKDKSGVLAIDSPVKGATIFVDEMPPRQVPTEVRVAAGKHTIKLTAAGYRDNVIDVEVVAGERRPIIIEPGEPPVYERWWFWTTIGVVVAGGVAGGVAAAYLIEGPPDEGTINPCQVKVQADDVGCEDGASTAMLPRRRSRNFNGPSGVRGSGFSFGPIPVFTVRF